MQNRSKTFQETLVSSPRTRKMNFATAICTLPGSTTYLLFRDVVRELHNGCFGQAPTAIMLYH